MRGPCMIRTVNEILFTLDMDDNTLMALVDKVRFYRQRDPSTISHKTENLKSGSNERIFNLRGQK